MSEESEKEYERALMKSSQLPYPLNYLRFENPALAVVTVKILEITAEKITRLEKELNDMKARGAI